MHIYDNSSFLFFEGLFQVLSHDLLKVSFGLTQMMINVDKRWTLSVKMISENDALYI